MPVDGTLVIESFGTKTGANGNKTITFKMVTTAPAETASVVVHPAANDEDDWHLSVKVSNFSAGVQRVFWIMTETSGVSCGYALWSIDTTITVTVSVTGECAHADDVISAKELHAKIE
jgi:hypothetical protein